MGQGPIDITGMGVVPLDQVGIITVHGPQQVAHPLPHGRGKPPGKGRSLGCQVQGQVFQPTVAGGREHRLHRGYAFKGSHESILPEDILIFFIVHQYVLPRKENSFAGFSAGCASTGFVDFAQRKHWGKMPHRTILHGAHGAPLQVEPCCGGLFFCKPIPQPHGWHGSGSGPACARPRGGAFGGQKSAG